MSLALSVTPLQIHAREKTVGWLCSSTTTNLSVATINSLSGISSGSFLRVTDRGPVVCVGVALLQYVHVPDQHVPVGLSRLADKASQFIVHPLSHDPIVYY